MSYRRAETGAGRSQESEVALRQLTEITDVNLGTDFASIDVVRSWVLIAFVAAGCGDNLSVPTPDAGPAEITPQGSEPSADLIINEVSPRGEGADWIEIANRSSAAIDLCDYFLSDSLDRLDHYLPLGGAAPPDSCEPSMLEPGGYLVITADDDTGAPFKLGLADEVHLIRTADGFPVDTLVYLYQTPVAGQALARRPDREGLFLPATPTPGEANR